VNAVVLDARGSVYAGGDFLDADGDPNADRVAQWLTKTALNGP
jgi:hypothetical protein